MISMIRQRIEELRRQLDYHNHKYYVENAPEISDFDFDAMMRELQELEREHPEYADPASPTLRVGSDLGAEFRTVRHRYPMLSLGNTYSLDELHEFLGRIEREAGATDYVCELKFDGTAISLTYEHGRLVQALTRGDGVEGDDVTANVRTVRSVPLRLRGEGWPELFEIRGEVLMPYASFDRLNAEREANGEQLFANPRNAAAGTLKQQQSAVVARRGLDCTLYQLTGDDLPFATHWESLEKAREWGFKVSGEARICRSVAEIDAFIAHWDEAATALPHRRRGRQGERLRRAAATGLHGQGTEMGRGLQVQGRAGPDTPRKRLLPGGPHGRRHPRGEPRSGAAGRNHRAPRDAA